VVTGAGCCDEDEDDDDEPVEAEPDDPESDDVEPDEDESLDVADVALVPADFLLSPLVDGATTAAPLFLPSAGS
jgi:hypothetical protein